MTRASTVHLFALAAMAAATLPLCGMGGCKTRIGGGKEGQTAELARRVTDLEREVQLQSLRANEAEAKLTAGTPSAEVALATPVLAGIEIDRLSGPTRSDTRGFPVFIRTLDGRARFLQVVGTLEVEVLLATPDPSSTPTVVGSARLTPLELREAYRSSVAGTHYRVDIAASDAFVRASGYRGGLARYDLQIVARLDDAATGRRHEATALIPARDQPRGR